MLLGLLVVISICVSPTGALGLLRPATSATATTACVASSGTLLPVGLAVLVYETYLRLRGQLEWARLVWGRQRWGLPLLLQLMVVLVVVGVVAVVWWGLVRNVGSSQGLHNLAVQNAEGDAGNRVLEVVLSGQAVVEAGV